jgi:hypothetical protein
VRILLVVIRSTAGWIDARGKRKTRDWITHRQFQVRTGRAGESVSKAIDSLVRQGFLEVTDERGRFLNTASSRKSRFAKLYYQLGPLLRQPDIQPTRKTGVEKPKATKATANKRKPKQRDFQNSFDDASKEVEH